ncbi:hypothetical protein ACWFMI_15220 [Nocardiopsis terrae]
MNQSTDTRSEALANRLTRLLNDPGLPEEAVTRLISADAVFGHLDGLLRSGDELPLRWAARLGGGTTEAREVTDHYDALSEALRATGGNVSCWRALCRARDRWSLLKAALVSGSPLPEPWER